MVSLFCLVICLLVACSSNETAQEQPQVQQQPQTAPPDAASAADPLSGTWTGDWGPSARDRNQVTLELKWDGTNLTGTVNPGENGIPVQQSTFNPATGEVHFEADVSRGNATIHYVVDGKVQGNMMTGTWNHPNGRGDFTITRQ
jgi:hypothetical protein